MAEGVAALGRIAAVTGTPGTGKSTVSRLVAGSWRVAEVGELAVQVGAGVRERNGVTVDLLRLRRKISAARAGGPLLLVGHLAHLLPVSEVVVLRCDPRELVLRLTRARRGSAADRRENAAAEATDVVLLEAIRRGRRIWEIDTTRRSPATVAEELGRLLRRRPPSSYGRVDWLADPGVTDFLLRRAR